MKQPPDPMQRQFEMSRALQEEQTGTELSTQAPYLIQQQQMAQAALMEQLNPDEIINTIKFTLRGEVQIEGEIRKESIPLMNDFGIGKTVLTIRSVVNVNTIMSALSEVQIGRLMIDLMDEIIDDLTLNWRAYGIRQKSDLDKIEGVIKRLAYPALMRSKEGGERRFLGRTTVESITTAPRMPQQKREGFWSRFKL